MNLPSRRTDLDLRAVADEALVLDLRDGTACALSPAAARVFAACDGLTTAEGIGLPQHVIDQVLAELAEAGLLRTDAAGTSRRLFLQRSASVGASAGVMVTGLALPALADQTSGVFVPVSGSVPAGTTRSMLAPAGATSLTITATGGAGFSRGSNSASPGAVVVATIVLSGYPGQTFTLVGGSDAAHTSTSTSGGAPDGGTGGTATGTNGGGGGGSSSLSAQGAAPGASNVRLVVAGGGGGGDYGAGGQGSSNTTAASVPATTVTMGGNGTTVGTAGQFGAGGTGGGAVPGVGGAEGTTYRGAGQSGSTTGQGGAGGYASSFAGGNGGGAGGGGYTGGGGGGGVAGGGGGGSYSVASYTIKQSSGFGASGITYIFS